MLWKEVVIFMSLKQHIEARRMSDLSRISKVNTGAKASNL